MQQRLNNKIINLKKPYSYGFYNKYNDIEQWVRITEGCPHNCPFCYEPQEIKIFGVPKIIRNEIKIMDMNLLCKKEALQILSELPKKLNNKIINYELICGIDYRFLTQEIANELYKKHFKKIRLAWDWTMKDQYKIKDAINILKKAGYNSNRIMIFIICNWRIPYEECCRKLDLCKVWNVQVADCYYDGQVFPNPKKREEPNIPVISLFWTDKQNKNFRKKCRKHNQLINFRIDPKIK